MNDINDILENNLDLQNHPMSICNESSMPRITSDLAPLLPRFLRDLGRSDRPLQTSWAVHLSYISEYIISCWGPTINNNKQKTTKLGESESCHCFTWNFIIPKFGQLFFSYGNQQQIKKVAPKPRGLGETNPKSWTNPPPLESTIWSLEPWGNWDVGDIDSLGVQTHLR